MFNRIIKIGISVFSIIVAAMAYANDGTDLRIMILQEDSEGSANCVSYRNEAGAHIATKIGEQFNRYGYTVTPRESLGAELRFDLSRNLDKTQLISLATRAKNSGRAEFDLQAIVVYKILCNIRSDSIATTVDADVSGFIYDIDARRELGDFGPITKTFSMAPKCDARCFTMELRTHAGDMALIVADQARNKLAAITKQKRQNGDPNRIMTYNVRLENISQASNRIRTIMEKEFPGSIGITSLSSSTVLTKFGLKTTARPEKIRDWLEVVISDLGLENTSIAFDGNTFLIRNDGTDLPQTKIPTERIFR
jgi:hypothetical protein